MSNTDDTYKTISELSEGIYKEKGSKFIAYAYPICTDEEVKEHVQKLKKEYFDARHHCYAYRIGGKGELYRANDDGEPSGTAGKPILGQLLSNELTNILVVVIRYFGGIKLGTSGLIYAYKTATADAIANAEIIERTIDEQLRITFGYEVMNDIMRIIKEEQPSILSQQLDIACQMELSVRKSKADKLKERLQKVEGLDFEVV
ncbi:MAG: YigZ family protein [Prevotellaceae bacterium]|jgi:uncharacterized YigZ family protein|nr:YigZ family protein [Prevotellaceae bacterium]